MKTKAELAIIAANLSDSVRSVHCAFDKSGQLFTFKCRADLAATLTDDDLVVVEGGKNREFSVCRVRRVDDECILDGKVDAYKWVISALDLDALNACKDWEKRAVDLLYTAQRKRAKQAMLAEIGDAADLPALMIEVDVVDSAEK